MTDERDLLDDFPELTEAQKAHIRTAVEKFPPLTDAQRVRLMAVINAPELASVEER